MIELLPMGAKIGSHRSRRRRVGAIEKDILERLTLGDVLYGALLSGSSTKRMFKLARDRAIKRYRYKKAIERLKKLEFIEQTGDRLTLTIRGRTMLSELVEKTRASIEAREWDTKWRIAAFDIPEKFSTLRDRVRNTLKRAGFIKLQHSIWIFPHECDELMNLIQDEPGLSKYVLYGTLERIENEDQLKKAFKLH